MATQENYENEIGFINGFTQGGLFVGAQTANAVKSGISNLAEQIKSLSTIYQALSKTLITFAVFNIG